MFWWLKKFKVYNSNASINNSNGEEMKKKPYKKINCKTSKTFFSFFIGTNVYKKHKLQAILMQFRRQIGQTKGIIINYNHFL